MTEKEHEVIHHEIQNFKNQCARLTSEEQEDIKTDLLFFIHRVTHGQYSTLDELAILPTILELAAKFFA